MKAASWTACRQLLYHESCRYVPEAATHGKLLPKSVQRKLSNNNLTGRLVDGRDLVKMVGASDGGAEGLLAGAAAYGGGAPMLRGSCSSVALPRRSSSLTWSPSGGNGGGHGGGPPSLADAKASRTSAICVNVDRSSSPPHQTHEKLMSGGGAYPHPNQAGSAPGLLLSSSSSGRLIGALGYSPRSSG